MIRKVDRLILNELMQPFVFGLLSFSILMVSATMLKPALDFMLKYNLPFGLFLKMIVLGMPQVITFAFPMAVLLGSLLAISRLSNDNEIVALRAAGVSLWRAAAPAFFFGLTVTGVTFLLNEMIVPSANSEITTMKNDVIMRKTGAIMQENMVLPFYEEGKLAFLLIANKLEGDRLEGVKFYHFGESEGSDWWIYANTGNWVNDNWVFRDGERYQVMNDGTVLTSFFDSFDIKELNITSAQLRRKAKTSLEMNIAELRSFIRELKKEGLDKDARKNLTEYYFKFSTPFSCLFFVLIAFPLAISPARTSGGTGMGISLLIVLAYYVMLMLCTRLGQAGAIEPVIAGWIPNSVVAAVGLYLFRLKNV